MNSLGCADACGEVLPPCPPGRQAQDRHCHRHSQLGSHNHPVAQTHFTRSPRTPGGAREDRPPHPARSRQLARPPSRPIPFADPWSYELVFPRDPRAPRIARTTLRVILDAHELDELAYRAQLLTSELTTNSVRYALGPAGVRLQWRHPVLRVSVWDLSPDLPKPYTSAVGPNAEAGRGTAILELVADRWGRVRHRGRRAGHGRQDHLVRAGARHLTATRSAPGPGRRQEARQSRHLLHRGRRHPGLPGESARHCRG